MFDKKAALAALSLKASEGDTEASKAALELEKSLNYEQLMNSMDEDEFTEPDQLQFN